MREAFRKMNQRAAAESVERRMRVLVADDDIDVCSLISSAFRRRCVVTVAHDAEHALAIMAHEEPFDVIISDYMLPGVSGLEFISRVRSVPTWSSTPIIMISGHGTSLNGALSAGANAFLSKPFTLEQLRSIVMKTLAS